VQSLGSLGVVLEHLGVVEAHELAGIVRAAGRRRLAVAQGCALPSASRVRCHSQRRVVDGLSLS
jgi:hypothetical protein